MRKFIILGCIFLFCIISMLSYAAPKYSLAALNDTKKYGGSNSSKTPPSSISGRSGTIKDGAKVSTPVPVKITVKDTPVPRPTAIPVKSILAPINTVLPRYNGSSIGDTFGSGRVGTIKDNALVSTPVPVKPIIKDTPIPKLLVPMAASTSIPTILLRSRGSDVGNIIGDGRSGTIRDGAKVSTPVPTIIVIVTQSPKVIVTSIPKVLPIITPINNKVSIQIPIVESYTWLNPNDLDFEDMVGLFIIILIVVSLIVIVYYKLNS